MYCSDLAVHLENKAKLGMNHFRAHRVGSCAKQVGTDFAELASATAFYLSPEPNAREKKIQFNQKLVVRSGGMLAPASGGER